VLRCGIYGKIRRIHPSKYSRVENDKIEDHLLTYRYHSGRIDDRYWIGSIDDGRSVNRRYQSTRPSMHIELIYENLQTDTSFDQKQ
jgi:hypothetical protein